MRPRLPSWIRSERSKGALTSILLGDGNHETETRTHHLLAQPFQLSPRMVDLRKGKTQLRQWQAQPPGYSLEVGMKPRPDAAHAFAQERTSLGRTETAASPIQSGSSSRPSRRSITSARAMPQPSASRNSSRSVWHRTPGPRWRSLPQDPKSGPAADAGPQYPPWRDRSSSSRLRSRRESLLPRASAAMRFRARPAHPAPGGDPAPRPLSRTAQQAGNGARIEKIKVF